MFSVDLYEEIPTSHNHGHPSIQVEHIPLDGEISSFVQFFVNVAADLLGFEYVFTSTFYNI
jgi:hypothetical protein